MANTPRDELVSMLKHLLISGNYSDFVITCSGDTHNVHKAIVCARSGFFERAERFPGQEAATGKVDLPEDEPAIVKLLIQYMYVGEYEAKLTNGQNAVETASIPVEKPVVTVGKQPSYHYKFPHTCITGCPAEYQVCHHHECRRVTCNEACVDFVCEICCPDWEPTEPTLQNGDSQLLLHAKMYEIGDKYDVLGLKHFSREKFEWACLRRWNSVDFAPAAHYALCTTPEDDKGLREVVSRTLSENMCLLNKPEIQALLNEFNGLAVVLLNLRAEEVGWIKAPST